MTVRPKVIYLARRKSGLSMAAFRQRWLQHGRLAMSLPIWRNMWKYAQCDPLHPAGDWDAIGLVWYRSWEALDSIARQPELRQPLLDDELETFSGYVRDSAVLTEEEVIKSGPETHHKLFAFVPDGSGKSAEPLLATDEAVRSVRSSAVSNAYTASTGLDYRFVVENWYASEDEAMRSAERFEREFSSTGILVMPAHERPLYGPVPD